LNDVTVFHFDIRLNNAEEERMKVKELVSILFTEHPRTGYSAAVLTLALGAALFAGVLYGGATLAKVLFADTPIVEATPS
jgi:hypothetical protein